MRLIMEVPLPLACSKALMSCTAGHNVRQSCRQSVSRNKLAL